MDAEIKRKWVEALRSGKYAQARNTVRIEDAFCCLGVLCDIAGAEWKKNQFGYYASYAGDESMTGTPESLDLQIGLGDGARSEVMAMNDKDGKSFAEIADYIEEHL